MWKKKECEGGCGVIGVASSEKIKGKHLIRPLTQMCNRGNGKGGGIAACGLDPNDFDVTKEILENNTLLAIAYLNSNFRNEVEKSHIHSLFDVDHVYEMPCIENFESLGLNFPPPKVILYFVRVKKEKLTNSNKEEVVFKNSTSLNQTYYSSEGEKKAFVLSHGKNLLVLKIVGFAQDVIHYYKLENLKAHVWIGHHRYPTKGRVWHPGGAHPFIGLNEALVHNGDFANYASICEYLAQRDLHPHFLTDTEVAALLFDLLHRTYQYPLEYIFEVLAPTTERDFTELSQDKQNIYSLLQKTHMHGSPDGPWFFLIAQSLAKQKLYRLIGITDTSMLRPQVFALQEGTVSLGFSASEKQAIDALLQSLSEEDERIWPVADKYWSARGGSHTDGGAFTFNVEETKEGEVKLYCEDKFGKRVTSSTKTPFLVSKNPRVLFGKFPDMAALELTSWAKKECLEWDYGYLISFLEALKESANSDVDRVRAIIVFTKLLDQRFLTKKMRHSCILSLLNQNFRELIASFSSKKTASFAFFEYGMKLPEPESDAQTLVMDASRFPSEGESSAALEIVRIFKKGFSRCLVANCLGQRFLGAGLGPTSHGFRIDVYGSSGDYLGSGIDGAEIHVHGNGQDQLAQIMKEGKLVVHGDVGQTFLYGAKGGTAYILGNAAGRPLINAVGKTKAIINGTCLDYMAESFMAGDPLQGGGFAVINALTFDEEGNIEEQHPYPGGNLFSLASGGAIYIRDPEKVLSQDQLNGGDFKAVTLADWELILPYLEENASLFNIPVSRLLEFKGKILKFNEIYRKISPAPTQVLQEEEAWVKKV